jgi:hypothetical protein
MRALLLFPVLLFLGCSQQHMNTTYRNLQIDTTPSQVVEFQKTNAVKKTEGLEITGAVVRLPDAPAEVHGHIHVQIIDPNGQVIEVIPASLNPSPVSGNTPSKFLLLLNSDIPDGSTLQLTFTDTAHPWQRTSQGVSYGESARSKASGGHWSAPTSPYSAPSSHR